MVKLFRVICTMALVLSSPIPAFAAEKIITDAILDAAQEAATKTKEWGEDIDYVRESMEAIKDGKTPAAHDTHWKSLISDIVDLQRQVDDLQIPADYNKSEFAIDIVAYNACATRQMEQVKADGFSAALYQADSDAYKLLSTLTDMKTGAEGHRDAVVTVIKLSGQLAGSPVVGDFFTWNWFDLQTKVLPALNGLIDAAQSKYNKLYALRHLIIQQRSNFDANIKTLDDSGCVLTGVYDGKWTNKAGQTGTFVLTLTEKTGPEFDYACSMTYPGLSDTPCVVDGWDLDEHWIDFSRDSPAGSGYVAKYDFDIASDYRTATGQQWWEPGNLVVGPNELRKR